MAKEYMNQNQKRNDMNRIGLFSEMPYLLGDKYEKIEKLKSTRDSKLPQMYPSAIKTKSGALDDYFDKKFKRLYENEKWISPFTGFYISPRDGNKKQTSGKPGFLPWPGTKRHSTPGDYYGAFGPKLSVMLNNFRKPKPKSKEMLPNIKIKSTNTRGPGYADIGFDKFPSHMINPYDNVPKKTKTSTKMIHNEPFKPWARPDNYFHSNPNKPFNNDYGPTYRREIREKYKDIHDGPFRGSKKPTNIGNGFDKWPKHEVDPYIDPYKILNTKIKKSKEKGINPNKFYQTHRNKSFYTTSIINKNVDIGMNITNWKTYKTTTTCSGPKPTCKS